MIQLLQIFISRSVFSPARGNRQVAADGLLRGSCLARADSHILSLELLREIITPELLRPTQPEATIIEPVRPITNPSLFPGKLECRGIMLLYLGRKHVKIFIS